MTKYALPGLRLGATSFVLPADYVTGLRWAAAHCDDVALLLMETGRCGELLPSAREIAEIGRIARGEGASLHLHLPTDADCDTRKAAAAMVNKAAMAMERAAVLRPHSFVLHLDFPSLRGTLRLGRACAGMLSEEKRLWTSEALARILALAPRPEQVAVENLESFPPSFWDEWVAASACSRCLDAGHVWKDGGNPAALLADWLPRLRVIHLHGVAPGRRDHSSLAFVPPAHLDALMHPLWQAGFAGVLTLELFGLDNFIHSHTALMRSWERYTATGSVAHR